MKKTLSEKITYFFNRANEARSTVNPFKAKEIKDELEPLVPELILEAVETIESQTNQITDLQNQISFLDGRLSQIEV